MASPSSTQHAIFGCPICLRKFTRGHNLRGHMRTHTDERPFACGVCGRAFTRQHDRRTHEQLHNRESKWVCGGMLKNGERWGCGRRYDRKSNLSRHHRSKIGRGCTKPTDGDAADGSRQTVEERIDIQIPDPTRLLPHRINAEHSAAIALTDIARTSNIGETSGVLLSQPNISHKIPLAPVNNASTRRHTAAVHKLVRWSSVQKLLDPFEYDHDYLMRLERQDKRTYPNESSDLTSPADDSILSTSFLAHDGAGDGSKSNPIEISMAHAKTSSMDSLVEIDQNRLFELSEKTSRRYYQCYLDRMHKLHPFLDELELDRKVEGFINCYCPQKSMLTTKTNRCQDSEKVVGDLFSDPSAPGHFVEPNLDNAIILLIFAVGAICDSEVPNSSPIMNRSTACRISRSSGPARQTSMTDYLLPAPLQCAQQVTMPLCEPRQTSSKSFLPSASTSRVREIGRSRMTKNGRDERGNATNQPVVHGWALYRLATAMVGNLQGATNLEYVHACLLAGLFAGQLADPFRSHVWISEAARAWQVFHETSSWNGHTKELRNFAYWTCLQLESDLLSELDIPASGMCRYEYIFPLPKRTYPMEGSDGLISPSTIMMMYYYSQIHIQKIRNNVHTNPYEIKNQGQASRLSSVQKAQILSLNNWRNSLPIPLRWGDTDEPAKEINAARMRARYYGTKYLLHLPLLYYALHYGGSILTSETQSHRNYANMKHMLSAMDSDTSNGSLKYLQHQSPPSFDWKELPLMVQHACRTCVECAIQSLRAFDGIENRLVVTNTFGTAHEQFGYMLVLSAIYNSSLSELVDRSTLDRLFKRTIRFLLQNENNSPTLRADNRILKELYSKLFRCASIPTDA